MRKTIRQHITILFNDGYAKEVLCKSLDDKKSVYNIVKHNSEIKALSKIHNGISYDEQHIIYKGFQWLRVYVLVYNYHVLPIIDKTFKICKKWEPEYDNLVSLLVSSTKYKIIAKRG